MALAGFDYANGADRYTLIDNSFITSYLTYADGDAVRVYLYGLFHASKGASPENTQEGFALALNLTETQILEYFLYWHDKGLVTVISKQPLEVRYLNIRDASTQNRKFSVAKYAEFNKQAESALSRAVMPFEFEKYYELLEDSGITQEALVMIMKYCAGIKGDKVGYSYILAVAKDWADGKAGGRLSAKDVEERLKQHEALSEEMRELFRVLGKVSAPQFEDKQTYIKWTKSWGYGQDEILYAAKLLKKNGGMPRLEKLLDEFFRNSCFTLADMKTWREKKEKNFALTLEIARRLTCYFQNLDYVIESYTLPWLSAGYDEKQLLETADKCFKRNKRDFEAMDAMLKAAKKDGHRELTADDFIDAD